MLLQNSKQPRATDGPKTPDVVIGTRHTEIGWIAIAWRAVAEKAFEIAGITIGHPSPSVALDALLASDAPSFSDELDLPQELLLHRLARYADGQFDSFEDIEVSLDHLAPFAKKVVQRCRKIPPGQTMSYGELAAACGSPHAARAVGNVMAANRYPLVVPCHRVVGSDGGLGGFSAPQGTDLKRRLLQREGVEI